MHSLEVSKAWKRRWSQVLREEDLRKIGRSEYQTSAKTSGQAARTRPAVAGKQMRL